MPCGRQARTRILDPGSGSCEMLCTRTRDYGITGTGVGNRGSFRVPVRQSVVFMSGEDRLIRRSVKKPVLCELHSLNAELFFCGHIT
ncbi:hypothetical protein F2T51_22335 [Salmonella enterica]|nr:hypothetical protein [Salmonella enterica]